MLAAAAQHDYLFMDMEHGAFTVQEATQICIASFGRRHPADRARVRRRAR